MDRFSGDKVIFLIALFLMLISVVSVFSSTPRLVDESHGVDRVAIMVDQLKVVATCSCWRGKAMKTTRSWATRKCPSMRNKS